MKLVIFAYHNIGYICIKELLKQKANIAAIFTHKDSKDENIWFKSVEKLARQKGIPVFTPSSKEIKSKVFFNKLKRLKPDIIFSFYYRYLLPQSILDIPPYGAFNLHGSYLPEYRGRCPVNWVIINGEKSTGVTLHYMEKKADSGDIVAQKRVPISFKDTALTLFRKMEKTAAELIRKTYPKIIEGKIKRIPQDTKKASYYGGRNPEDGKIEWDNSKESIYNLIRAVTHPYPGAFTYLNGEKLYVWKAQISKRKNRLNDLKAGTIVKVFPKRGMLVKTGNGYLLLKEVQLENVKTLKEARLFKKFKKYEGLELK
ncbi:MAG: formyltransferase [Candidatus Schekmanbacteria bacterium]|nr:MAG: formyltransferase [Candidatus Schekmanbacteria bacterium]